MGKYLDMIRRQDDQDPQRQEARKTVIEPACHPDGSPLPPVYFERSDGSIYGPVKVLDFMRASAGGPKRDWLVVEHQGLWEWVLSDRLRTRKQFEQQKPLREVELIREVR